MKPRFIRLGLLAAVAIVVASQYLRETTTKRAYRICAACGLEPDEIDQQIQNKSRSTLSRAEEIELYHSTGKPGDDLAPCLPCVEAVLDAAGEEKGRR